VWIWIHHIPCKYPKMNWQNMPSFFIDGSCECKTVFESYSFNVGKVRLNWKRQGVPLELIANVNIGEFADWDSGRGYCTTDFSMLWECTILSL
jgi:hypothetical protein